MSHDQESNARGMYEIRVQGVLDARWSDWFNGLAIGCERAGDGTQITALRGTIDQATLHGILARIRDLNLRLESVTQVGPLGSKSNSHCEGRQNGQTVEHGMA